jgi:hypothetical protein
MKSKTSTLCYLHSVATCFPRDHFFRMTKERKHSISVFHTSWPLRWRHQRVVGTCLHELKTHFRSWVSYAEGQIRCTKKSDILSYPNPFRAESGTFLLINVFDGVPGKLPWCIVSDAQPCLPRGITQISLYATHACAVGYCPYETNGVATRTTRNSDSEYCIDKNGMLVVDDLGLVLSTSGSHNATIATTTYQIGEHMQNKLSPLSASKMVSGCCIIWPSLFLTPSSADCRLHYNMMAAMHQWGINWCIWSSSRTRKPFTKALRYFLLQL